MQTKKSKASSCVGAQPSSAGAGGRRRRPIGAAYCNNRVLPSPVHLPPDVDTAMRCARMPASAAFEPLQAAQKLHRSSHAASATRSARCGPGRCQGSTGRAGCKREHTGSPTWPVLQSAEVMQLQFRLQANPLSSLSQGLQPPRSSALSQARVRKARAPSCGFLTCAVQAR